MSDVNKSQKSIFQSDIANQMVTCDKGMGI